MKTNYIEQMSVSDRNNTLNGYFNNLKESYKIFSDKKNYQIEQKADNVCNVLANGHFSLAYVLNEIRASDAKNAVYVNNNGSARYDNNEYAALRFKLQKTLNLIQKILYKLCHDSADSSITEENSEMSDIRQAMTWLFVDCVDSFSPTYQDRERIKILIKNNSNNAAEAEGLINFFNESVANSHGKEIDAVKTYKDVVRAVLGDMFNVLSNLINFSQYLVVVEDAVYPQSNSISTESTLNNLKVKPHMESILSLSEAVKILLIKNFVSFTKIKTLNMPHSFLSGAQFSHTTLSDGGFMSSDLSYSNFEYASARDCDFSMCLMDGANAVRADFTGSSFNYTSMINVDFSAAVLNNTAMTSVSFIDGALFDRNVYVQYHKTGSYLYYGNIGSDDKGIANKFNCFKDDNIERSFENIREVVVKKLNRSNTTEDAKSFREMVNYEKRGNEFNCGYIISDGKECVLDKIDKKIKDNMEKYRKMCDHNFLHPYCIQWAETQTDRKKDQSPLKKENFCVPNLSSASIKNSIMPACELSIGNISDASFNNTDMNSSAIYYTDAKAADFGSANFSDCVSVNSDFTAATFGMTNLINTLFIDCKMSSCNFSKALLINSTILNTEASGTFLGNKNYVEWVDGGKCKITVVKESDIAPKPTDVCPEKKDGNRDEYGEYGEEEPKFRAVIAHADMQESNFKECLASEIVIVGMNMDRSNFVGADFKRSFIYDCMARWSDYYRINFSYSIIFGVSFGHSSFNNATFTSAHLFADEFSECNLSKSNFVNCKVSNCIFSDCDFADANFSNAEFSNCSFVNMNISGVNLANCKFTNCLFDNVNFCSEETTNSGKKRINEHAKNLKLCKFNICCFVEDLYGALQSFETVSDRRNTGFLQNCTEFKAE